MKGQCSFFELLALWNLGGYARHKVNMVDESASQRKDIATSLLRFKLGERLQKSESFSFRNLEMLSILLDYGADPGSSRDILSLQLLSAQQCLKQLRKHITTNPQICKQSDLDWAQSFCMLAYFNHISIYEFGMRCKT